MIDGPTIALKSITVELKITYVYKQCIRFHYSDTIILFYFSMSCFFNYSLKVCTNGLMCLKQAYTGYDVPVPGTTSPNFAGMYCMAPYLTDLDSSSIGKVWYQIYDTTAFPALANHVAVTKAESLVFNRYAVSFDAVLVVKVTWENMPGFEGSADQVCQSVETNAKKLDFVTNSQYAPCRALEVALVV